MNQEIIVLRYGHRVIRDQRVTTHCCLVSRALNAKKIIICGVGDDKLDQTINKINTKWGKSFSVEYSDSWKKEAQKLKENGYTLIHLTMKGENFSKLLKTKINENKKLVVIIGSQKVEPDVYNYSDFNIAIGKDPHSEIAALGIFLYSLQNLLE